MKHNLFVFATCFMASMLVSACFKFDNQAEFGDLSTDGDVITAPTELTVKVSGIDEKATHVVLSMVVKTGSTLVNFKRSLPVTEGENSVSTVYEDLSGLGSFSVNAQATSYAGNALWQQAEQAITLDIAPGESKLLTVVLAAEILSDDPGTGPDLVLDPDNNPADGDLDSTDDDDDDDDDDNADGDESSDEENYAYSIDMPALVPSPVIDGVIHLTEEYDQAYPVVVETNYEGGAWFYLGYDETKVYVGLRFPNLNDENPDQVTIGLDPDVTTANDHFSLVINLDPDSLPQDPICQILGTLASCQDLPQGLPQTSMGITYELENELYQVEVAIERQSLGLEAGTDHQLGGFFRVTDNGGQYTMPEGLRPTVPTTYYLLQSSEQWNVPEPDGDEDGDVEEETDGDEDGDVEEETDGDEDGDIEEELDGDEDGDVEEETDGDEDDDVEEETDGDEDGDIEEDGDVEEEEDPGFCTPGDILCCVKSAEADNPDFCPAWFSMDYHQSWVCNDEGTAYELEDSCDGYETCKSEVCVDGFGCRMENETGTTCNDGSTCTVDDTCVNGVCTGNPLQCDDNNECTQDDSDSLLEGCCIHTPIPGLIGLACDDHLECTTSSTCQADGQCLGTPDQPHCCEGHKDDMVLSTNGDYCIDLYEGVLSINQECLGPFYGQAGDDYPDGFPDGVGASEPQSFALYACSLLDTIPSRELTFWQAKQACENAGKRLCTQAEWQGSCEGDPATAYPYGDEYVDMTCNGLDYGTGAVLVSASAMLCFTSQAVYDLSGNVEEWVSNPVQTCGGSYNSISTGLMCSSCYDRSVTATDATRGFRCCADPATEE